ncbi:hypothetical protein SLEP1_g45915 [Rubroshorea leprosula]|uniref:Uncharacterized protein n=1 Tax=Rubroshorea leprosula TaxID=152421 RepID=A0AAV5LKJ6_9ROSI|nr:hypothetical protein SLEP1_g45915 [Rubroshorea leprosula]
MTKPSMQNHSMPTSVITKTDTVRARNRRLLYGARPVFKPPTGRLQELLVFNPH